MIYIIYQYQMAQFIRCPSCGFCIGVYMQAFDAAKIALYEETVFASDSKFVNYDPEKLSLMPGSAPPLEPIFNAFGIKNRCCRMHMLAKVDFDRQYK